MIFIGITLSRLETLPVSSLGESPLIQYGYKQLAVFVIRF